MFTLIYTDSENLNEFIISYQEAIKNKSPDSTYNLREGDLLKLLADNLTNQQETNKVIFGVVNQKMKEEKPPVYQILHPVFEEPLKLISYPQLE